MTGKIVGTWWEGAQRADLHFAVDRHAGINGVLHDPPGTALDPVGRGGAIGER